ncbi:MAG: DEAD/DEAH box helicase [Candidatus Lokiarchaeota archaeon]|nr:DEAD/DEAH box helicase [Candidatus Lokiarchaeota archaeon]
MTTVFTKDFFIVFDRNRENKKQQSFNLNFFYLKSFKKKSKSFSYISNPFFRGIIVFGLNHQDKFQVVSFSKLQNDDSLQAINPRLFKKFLLDAKNKFVALSDQTQPNEFKPINEMLRNLQFGEEKILNLTFCKRCLENKKFTLLSDTTKIKSLQNQFICSNCALEIIIKQASAAGLISSKKPNPKLKNFFNHLISKFRDAKRVLDSFKVDFNPVNNKEMTLYDVEKNPQVSKKYLNYRVDDLAIQNKYKTLLKSKKILTLLPIQAISIEEGLLKQRSNQLITAPTSAGKTLVGELAGVSRIISDKRKMLYLVPIRALASLRTVEFKSKYKSLNLKIIKRIGESLLDKKEPEDLDSLETADIIIATYEAIDHILRSGNKAFLGSIGTIIIDEIQTLSDQERGFILDGLIARLKSVFSDAQYLYLSATIGAPDILAKKLNCILINYNNRPVPIERHLILCLNESIKLRNISRLVRAAYLEKSSYGFKGQSIIFTNSRKKCESLTAYLQNKDIRAKSYHSGLTNDERLIIEKQFQNQSISAVVATAALAAGVDLPAKQVIFESLLMGINVLTVAEFEQMLGRAGRLKKHDFGRAYLLIEPGKNYSHQNKMTEENIAINLLNGKIKDFELHPDEDKSLTELLAFISVFNEGIEKAVIYKFHDDLINANYEIEEFIKKLINYHLIRLNKGKLYEATSLGRSVAKSFLTVEVSLNIIEELQEKEKRIREIVLDLKSLRNVYLTKKVVADLSKHRPAKYSSNNFFSASVLSLMDANYVRKRKSFSDDFITYVVKWTKEIFNCDCKDKPYCDCGRLNLEKLILSLRIENNFSIKEISEYLEDELEIMIYKGDITDYLENLIYSFESILNISKGIQNLDPTYNEEISDIPNIIERIRK